MTLDKEWHLKCNFGDSKKWNIEAVGKLLNYSKIESSFKQPLLYLKIFQNGCLLEAQFWNHGLS